MLRTTIWKKNEENNNRELEFDYTPEFAHRIRDELDFLLNGVHIVDEEGDVYVVTVSNLENVS
jgi:hypothetical protein